VWVGGGSACDAHWGVALANASATVLGVETSKEAESRGAWTRSLDKGERLVEVGTSNGARGTVWLATDGELRELSKSATLALRTPPACGCEGTLRNPLAP
jgi:hypothetical protein